MASEGYTVLAIPVTDQVLAFVLNGLATLLLAAFAYFARRAWQKLSETFTKMEHLDKCMDRTREVINEHLDEARGRDQRIRELQAEASEERQARVALEHYIKGVFNLPIDAPLTEIKPEART